MVRDVAAYVRDSAPMQLATVNLLDYVGPTAGDKAKEAKLDKPVEKADESYLSQMVGSFIPNERAKQAVALELKMIPLFMPGQVGTLGTIAVNALDRAHPADSLRTQIIDFGLGATEGAALRGLYATSAHLPGGFLSRGLALGLASNALDTALDRRSYLDEKGGFDLTRGLSATYRNTFDPTKVGLMVTTAALGAGTVAVADNFANGLLTRSPLFSTVLTGGTMGFYGGSLGEMSRQGRAGEGFNLWKVLGAGVEQGALVGLAAVPGGLMAESAATRARAAADAARDKTPLEDAKHGKLLRTTTDINGVRRFEFEDGSERVARADDSFTTYTKDGKTDTRVMPKFDEGMLKSHLQNVDEMRANKNFTKQRDGSITSQGLNTSGEPVFVTLKADGTYIEVTRTTTGGERGFTIMPDGRRYTNVFTPAGHPSPNVTTYGDEVSVKMPDGSTVRKLNWGLTEIMKPDGTYIAGTGGGSADVSISKPDGTWVTSKLGGVHHYTVTKDGTAMYNRTLPKDAPQSDWMERMSDRLTPRFDSYAVDRGGTMAGIRDLWTMKVLHQPQSMINEATAKLQALNEVQLVRSH